MAEKGFQVVGVPSGKLAAVFQTGSWRCSPDEIDGHVLDDGHVLGSVAGAESRLVVTKDHVEHPVQSVLDPPVGADGAGEGGGVEWQRGQIVAAGDAGLAVALDRGLDQPKAPSPEEPAPTGAGGAMVASPGKRGSPG